MGITDIAKLLETGWGQALLMGGMVVVLLTNRRLTLEVDKMITKLGSVDKYITEQKAVAGLKDRELERLTAEISDLKERIRELEKYSGG